MVSIQPYKEEKRETNPMSREELHTEKKSREEEESLRREQDIDTVIMTRARERGIKK
jgi:hypothetical protein